MLHPDLFHLPAQAYVADQQGRDACPSIAENIVGVFDGSHFDESFFGRKQIAKSTRRFFKWFNC